MLNLKEAAQKLGLHKETVREKAKAGIIPAHKKCGRWYFFYEELVYWIKSGNNQAVQNDTANKEVSSWQNSLTLKNTKTSGITHSPRQMDSEYAAFGRLCVETVIKDFLITAADSAAFADIDKMLNELEIQSAEFSADYHDDKGRVVIETKH